MQLACLFNHILEVTKNRCTMESFEEFEKTPFETSMFLSSLEKKENLFPSVIAKYLLGNECTEIV